MTGAIIGFYISFGLEGKVAYEGGLKLT